ncbi:MAG: CHASE2 domain-containing protein, partial [Vampirovibrionia bacterium]
MQIKNRYIFILTILVVVILHSIGLFGVINDRIYDSFILLNQLKSKSTDIVIVSIDAKSVNSIGEWPFKRSIFADAIDIIIKDSPAVVGINLSITDNKELETDQKLYDVLRSF